MDNKQVIKVEHVVKMGQYIVTDKENDTIHTFALASCVAVTAYSPAKKAAGMIHVVLPFPLGCRDSVERPGYFAATGVPLLINAMCGQYGCEKEELQIQMFGGANSIDNQDVYEIGMKNIDAVKNSLHSMGLEAQKTDLRGDESRTLEMSVKTGKVHIYRQPLYHGTGIYAPCFID